MAVNKRKKNHKSKRQQRPYPRRAVTASTPSPGGFVATINIGGIDMPHDLIECLHDEGMMVYGWGRKDSANGAAALSMNEFKALCPHEPDLVYEYAEALTQAQYSQYLDGYAGEPYRERVVFKKDY